MARTIHKPEKLEESVCVEEDGEESEEKSVEREGQEGPDDVRVLHVDDSPEFVEMASTHLRRNDSLNVETETDPVEALERLREGDFDCVISDCSMPDMEMNGMELCEVVHSEHPSLPFVFFTGTPVSEFPDEIIADEDTGHMMKEIDVAQFSNLAIWITETV